MRIAAHVWAPRRRVSSGSAFKHISRCRSSTGDRIRHKPVRPAWPDRAVSACFVSLAVSTARPKQTDTFAPADLVRPHPGRVTAALVCCHTSSLCPIRDTSTQSVLFGLADGMAWVHCAVPSATNSVSRPTGASLAALTDDRLASRDRPTCIDPGLGTRSAPAKRL